MNEITLSIIVEFTNIDKIKQIASMCNDSVELVIGTSKVIKNIKDLEESTEARITVIKHTARTKIDDKKRKAIKSASGKYITFIEPQDEIESCYVLTILKAINQTNNLDYIKLFWNFKSWKNRCFYGCNNLWATFANVYSKDFAIKLDYSETPRAEKHNTAIMNEAKGDAIMTAKPLYYHYDRKG